MMRKISRAARAATRDLMKRSAHRRLFVATGIGLVLISCIAVLPTFITAAAATVSGVGSSATTISCPAQMFSEKAPTSCAHANTVSPASTVAAGFQESVAINNLVNPTSVHFAPDGRVYITEKSGLILVYSSLTATTPTIFADLRTEVDDYWDRGLMDIALDPNFPASPYMYAIYAFDAPIGGTSPVWNDSCPTPPGATTDGCMISGRLVRLTADATGNTMVPGSETVIINAWCQQFPSHSTDDIAFGPDGALYITAGEGSNFNAVDYGQFGGTYAGDSSNPCGDPPGGVGGAMMPPTAEGGSLRAQSMRRPSGQPVLLNGTLLRIDPATGDGLPNNPNASSSNLNARRIDAYGLRNPFRFTFRPGTNEVWVGDVGAGTWEEIDRVTDPTKPSLNFGWPCYEGNSPQPSFQSVGLNMCNSLYASPSLVTKPYYSYQHGVAIVPGENCTTSNGSSISGLAFYQGSAYPSAYHGALFFADYSRNCVWAMQLGSNGLPDPSNVSIIVGNAGHPVDLETGPGGDLFYADLNDGQIRRIQAVGPNAIINATSPTSGPSPLTVQFDGTQSTDPDPSATLTYAWDLNGDGNFSDSTSATPSYTYNADGQYFVRLKITDSNGLTNVSNPLTITVGKVPTPTILSPSSSLTWKVGDTISFSGSAVNGSGVALPASALSWTVLLHHCVGNTSECHIHFIQTFNGTAGGSFTGPDHEYPSYLELLLTATDPINGLSATTSVQLYPQTVALTFHSSPLGASLSVDGFTGATPFAYSVIVGSNNSVSAPAQQALNHRAYVYTSWSDGGAQTHTVLAGNTPTTYNAVYSPIQIEASKVILPDTSSAAPALWTAGKQPAAGAPLAVLSWIASDSSHNIFVERSANGVTYTSRVRLADSSPTTPAVLVVNSSVVVLAWIGTDAAHRLNVMYDAYGAQRKITLSDTSAYAPGLAFYSGQVWLAWTGGDGGHSLNVMPLGPQGLTPGHKVTLGNFHGRSSPTLVADPIGARLLLTWSQLAAPGVITLSTSSNGVNWVVPAGLPAGQTSASAPSALGLKPTHLNSHTYYWAWTGTDASRSLCLMYANTITSWSAPVTFNEYAMGSPALGYQGPNGSVLIAWTGTDSAHHLNIAVIRN